MTDHAQRDTPIKAAILRVVNTAFACGQWDGPEVGDYQELVDDSDYAQKQLHTAIAAALAQTAQPVWSKDKPTVAGWYWFRGGKNLPAGVYQLTEVDIRTENYSWSGEWVGPLSFPKERDDR